MTSDKEAGGEMKSCPFCDGPVSRRSRVDRLYCNTCGACGPVTFNEARVIWNDAYCWKEIDRLKKELADFREALEKVRCQNSDPPTGEWIDDLDMVKISEDVFEKYPETPEAKA
jgi:hypothetical protein